MVELLTASKTKFEVIGPASNILTRSSVHSSELYYSVKQGVWNEMIAHWIDPMLDGELFYLRTYNQNNGKTTKRRFMPVFNEINKLTTNQ
jgi:hypothetical protein